MAASPQNDRIGIVSCEPHHFEAAAEWFADPVLKKKLWSWQFESARNAGGGGPLAAEAGDGRVVGFNGCMPVTVKLGEQREAAIWSCDFFVDRNHRGGGIGRRIKAELQRRHPLILALGISEVASHVHEASGWRANRSALSFVRFNQSRNPRELAKRILQMVQGMMSWRRRRLDDALSVSIGKAGELPADVEELWRRSEPGYDNVIVRDAAYLQWRYGRHPLMQYRLVAIRRSGRLEALGVFWATPERAALVDYVGPASAETLKRAIVAAFCAENRHVARLACLTTDVEFHAVLREFGFNVWRSRAVLFNVYAAGPLAGQAHRDWFLMGGDSDGDILEAANAADAIFTEVWSEEELESHEREWRELHARSNADPLFLSWEWQWTWWRTFGHVHRLQGYWIAARRHSGELVGIAPLFKDARRHLGMLSTRVQFCGNIWRGPRTMRTEYLEFIVDRACAARAADALLNHLHRDPDWDEFILSDLDQASPTAAALLLHPILGRALLRNVDRFTGYSIGSSGGFEAFLARISGAARRKIFNLRGRLEAAGEVRIEHASHMTFREFVQRLDRLHQCRWGRRFFDGGHGAFHSALVDRLSAADELQFSVMTIDGRDASALYNIRRQGREYNLQGGFDQSVAPGLPLGLLHLGYAIERAFHQGVRSFELLIGAGKHRDFKRDFADPARQILVLHVLRSTWLAMPYRVYDRFRGERGKRGKHSSPAGPA